MNIFRIIEIYKDIVVVGKKISFPWILVTSRVSNYRNTVMDQKLTDALDIYILLWQDNSDMENN